jgi:hypothetical protein
MTKQGYAQVSITDVSQVAGPQAVTLERLAVADQTVLIVSAPINEVESNARQFSARHLAQVF